MVLSEFPIRNILIFALNVSFEVYFELLFWNFEPSGPKNMNRFQLSNADISLDNLSIRTFSTKSPLNILISCAYFTIVLMVRSNNSMDIEHLNHKKKEGWLTYKIMQHLTLTFTWSFIQIDGWSDQMESTKKQVVK